MEKEAELCITQIIREQQDMLRIYKNSLPLNAVNLFIALQLSKYLKMIILILMR